MSSEETGAGETLYDEIARDAKWARSEGRLPAGFLEELEKQWDEIAGDKASLEAAVLAQAAATRGEALQGAAGGSGARARRLARRGAYRARRFVGPPARKLERRSAATAIRLAEEWATQSEVLLDRARRIGSGSSAGRRLSRVAPLARTFSDDTWRSRAALDPALREWLAERLVRRDVTRVVQVESGDGELLRLLVERGLSARGAEPLERASGAGLPPGTVSRQGGFEYLGHEQSRSLEALVLSGMTDRIRPSSARSLVQLASRKLEPGGHLAIVSLRPERVVADDPINSDLSARRPLHPVTWCHLVSRYEFSEISVDDEARYAHYVVFARNR